MCLCVCMSTGTQFICHTWLVCFSLSSTSVKNKKKKKQLLQIIYLIPELKQCVLQQQRTLEKSCWVLKPGSMATAEIWLAPEEPLFALKQFIGQIFTDAQTSLLCWFHLRNSFQTCLLSWMDNSSIPPFFEMRQSRGQKWEMSVHHRRRDWGDMLSLIYNILLAPAFCVYLWKDKYCPKFICCEVGFVVIHQNKGNEMFNTVIFHGSVPPDLIPLCKVRPCNSENLYICAWTCIFTCWDLAQRDKAGCS